MTELRPEIQTSSGLRLNPFEPQEDQIVVEDIAQALSNLCRFGGHCRRFYSVAQHSSLLADVMAERGGDAPACLWALLHDAAEAYLLDLPHPLKHRSELGELYRAVEAPLQTVILRRFGLPAEPPANLKALDNALLVTEKAALMPPVWDWPELAGVDGVDVEIEPWPPERARSEFLGRFAELTKP